MAGDVAPDYRMQNVAVLNAGKALTDPLFVLLTIALVALALGIRRDRRANGRMSRALAIAFASMLTIAILSTHAVSELLERTLLIDTQPTNVAPDVIVVPGGGSLRGAARELDILSDSSESRVVAAVHWWRAHPRARIVISGSDRTLDGPSTRTAELMRDQAIRLGVPPAAVTLETRSLNTREHALRLRELRGITSTTRVGVVTSAWHLRRTTQEFRRSFATVIPYAAESLAPRPFSIGDFIPSSHALRYSTRSIHEWIGIAWYALGR